MIGIYTIINTRNNKCYIGSSKNIESRFKAHKSRLRNNKHINYHLQNAWNKYGEDSFEFNVLYITSIEDLIKEEQKLLDLKPEYNILPTVELNRQLVHHSDKTKQKISEKKKGIPLSNETKLRISRSLKGRKRSSIHQENLTKALTGLKRSKDKADKIRLAHQIYAKPIFAIHLSSLERLEFASVNEAAQQGYDQSSILKCLKGQRRSHKGFSWHRSDSYSSCI